MLDAPIASQQNVALHGYGSERSIQIDNDYDYSQMKNRNSTSTILKQARLTTNLPTRKVYSLSSSVLSLRQSHIPLIVKA